MLTPKENERPTLAQELQAPDWHPRSSFLAVLAGSLSLGMPSVAQAQHLDSLRVGSAANDSYAEPFYAEDRGFFQRAGLDVSVQAFPSGATVTTALAGNAIDAGITNPISLANAVEHGVPFQFFAVAATYNPEEVALCVAADSSIREAKDLNGKTVGTTAIKDSNSLHIVAWVDRNGGDSSSISLVEMPFSAMAPAIRRGTVSFAALGRACMPRRRGRTVIRMRVLRSLPNTQKWIRRSCVS